jgi:isopenicillin N synthase-like dioxygenase
MDAGPIFAAEAGAAAPVIDIGALRRADLEARAAVSRELRRACITTGFFYITGHGVDEARVATLFAAAKRFFDLPQEIRDQVAMSKSRCKRGYDGIGRQSLDAATGLDRKESFFVGVELGPEHPLVRAGTPNHGPNQWPAGLPLWREQIVAYCSAMESLGRTLMSGLALSLGLAWSHFEPCLVDHMASLRLLHYPPHPTADPEREVGCGAHTDWGAITILAQDETGGLEIRQPNGTWVAARPVPGAFIVNIGDMMQRWTNDLYVSTPHRVLNRSLKDRYSAAYFFDPAYHTRVTCIDTCCTAGRPARYPPITSGDHLIAMYRKTYGLAGTPPHSQGALS